MSLSQPQPTLPTFPLFSLPAEIIMAILRCLSEDHEDSHFISTRRSCPLGPLLTCKRLHALARYVFYVEQTWYIYADAHILSSDRGQKDLYTFARTPVARGLRDLSVFFDIGCDQWPLRLNQWPLQPHHFAFDPYRELWAKMWRTLEQLPAKQGNRGLRNLTVVVDEMHDVQIYENAVVRERELVDWIRPLKGLKEKGVHINLQIKTWRLQDVSEEELSVCMEKAFA